MISLVNVQKLYDPDQYALRHVDLQVKQGGFLFVAGASGAGKSTLLKLLFGAERASVGEVIIGGRDISLLDIQGIADLRKEIGVIFQDYKLLTKRSVLENVAFGLKQDGFLVIGTFSKTGPNMCSGLPVQPYSEEQLCALFDANFKKVKCFSENHSTPAGNLQNFLFCVFQLRSKQVSNGLRRRLLDGLERCGL